MKRMMEWIDSVKALRAASPATLRSQMFLAEQLLEDEANNFRNRVLIYATNTLVADGLEPKDGAYRVDFTR